MPKKKEEYAIKSTAKKASASASQKTKSDYTKLTDYIQDVYLKANFEKEEIPWAYLSSQISSFVKQYGINYKDILHILQYMVQIEGINFTDKDSLGLIPYYIDKTNGYISKYKEVNKAVKEFDYSEKTITIIPNKQQVRYKKKNETFD